MPRLPRSNNSRTRRDEILDEATRLFAERGYEGASMADLADSVGMRKASLFYHFASKELLYAAVIERLLTAFSAGISQATAAEGSYSERLDVFTEAIVGVLGSQAFAARLFVREVMDWGPVIRATLADSMLNALNSASEFVKAGQGTGEFVDGDPQQIVLTVTGAHFLPFAITGLAHRMTGKEPSDPEFVTARVDATKQHVRRMLLKVKNGAA